MFAQKQAPFDSECQELNRLYAARDIFSSKIRKQAQEKIFFAKRMGVETTNNYLLSMTPFLLNSTDTQIQWIEELINYATFSDCIPEELKLDTLQILKVYDAAVNNLEPNSRKLEQVVFKCLNRMQIWQRASGSQSGWWIDRAFQYLETDRDVIREIHFFLFYQSEKQLRKQQQSQNDSDDLAMQSKKKAWHKTNQDPNGQKKVACFLRVVGRTVPQQIPAQDLQDILRVMLYLFELMDLQARQMVIPFLAQSLYLKQQRLNALHIMELMKTREECELIIGIPNFQIIVECAQNIEIFQKTSSLEILFNILGTILDSMIIEGLSKKYNLVALLGKQTKSNFLGLKERAYWGLSNIASHQNLVQDLLPLLPDIIKEYQEGVFDRISFETQLIIINALQSSKEIIEEILTKHPKSLTILFQTFEGCWEMSSLEESAFNAVLYCSDKSDLFRKTVEARGVKDIVLRLYEHKNPDVFRMADEFLSRFQFLCKRDENPASETHA